MGVQSYFSYFFYFAEHNIFTGQPNDPSLAYDYSCGVSTKALGPTTAI
jgi:hypothetical protein